MKSQLFTAILPPLPIVGVLKLSSRDGKTISHIDVVNNQGPSVLNPLFNRCYEELFAYLSGKKKKLQLPLDMSEIKPFQLRVLQEMQKIPFGKTQSYKDLAQRMNSRAYQAIGSACGRNPFMLIFPCHRVTGSQNLGGFAHGLPMKKKLLALEGVSFNK